MSEHTNITLYLTIQKNNPQKITHLKSVGVPFFMLNKSNHNPQQV